MALRTITLRSIYLPRFFIYIILAALLVFVYIGFFTRFVMRLSEDTSIPIRILTKNIRYATGSPTDGEKPWNVRVLPLVNELRFNTWHCKESFICLQEALFGQVHDILANLNQTDQWSYIGVGRDDGQEDGEFSPILFRTSVWKLEHFETIWLSPTPNEPSIGWDVSSVRHVW